MDNASDYGSEDSRIATGIRKQGGGEVRERHPSKCNFLYSFDFWIPQHKFKNSVKDHYLVIAYSGKESEKKVYKYTYMYICITQSLSAHPNHNIASQLYFNFSNAIKDIIGSTDKLGIRTIGYSQIFIKCFLRLITKSRFL